MARSRDLTEARLREALQRLLDGRPVRTKISGSITPNKINNEAGLGNSYIYKFPDFLDYAKPIIEKHNEVKNKAMEGKVVLSEIVLSEKEKFRIELQREKRLKERYRQERDDSRKAKNELESLNNTLMFRLYELQEELRHHKEVPIISGKK